LLIYALPGILLLLLLLLILLLFVLIIQDIIAFNFNISFLIRIGTNASLILESIPDTVKDDFEKYFYYLIFNYSILSFNILFNLLFYFILFYFILFYFILFYFILFIIIILLYYYIIIIIFRELPDYGIKRVMSMGSVSKKTLKNIAVTSTTRELDNWIQVFFIFFYF
jgi:hypothetical protein